MRIMDQCGYPDTCLLDARVHCAVLKVRKTTHPNATTRPRITLTGTTERYDGQAGLPKKKHPPPPHTARRLRAVGGGPFPQDPTACLRPDLLTHPRSRPSPRPAPREGPAMDQRAVLAADDHPNRTGQRSTLELRHQHTGPPHDWEGLLVGARLWTTIMKTAASAP